MIVLRRLALMLAAYLAGAATVVPVVMLMMTVVLGDRFLDPVMIGYSAAAFVLVVVLTFLPTLLIVAVAEWKRIRDWRYFIVSGVGLAIVLTIAFGFMPGAGPDSAGFYVGAFLIVAGSLAGLVYWAIAGRNAGSLRDAWLLFITERRT